MACAYVNGLSLSFMAHGGLGPVAFASQGFALVVNQLAGANVTEALSKFACSRRATSGRV